MYQMTSKFHFLYHIVWMSQYLNPRLTWCYAFESFVGWVVTSAKACVAGTPSFKVSHKVAENCLMALLLGLDSLERHH